VIPKLRKKNLTQSRKGEKEDKEKERVEEDNRCLLFALFSSLPLRLCGFA
jgi:hypothetical protein